MDAIKQAGEHFWVKVVIRGYDVESSAFGREPDSQEAWLCRRFTSEEAKTGGD